MSGGRSPRNVLIPAFGPILMYQFDLSAALDFVGGRVEGIVPTRPGSRCRQAVSLERALNELNVLSQLCSDAVWS
jgi:hypothetical protein